MNINVKGSKDNYDIFIKNNLLDNLEDYLDANKNYIIIADDQIPNIYIEKVKKFCINNFIIRFPAGEKSKSIKQYSIIIDKLIDNLVKRDSVIIALGGGVTGDLAGFVASTFYRGIEYIQIPTSLLAQIDSSVGGKVAINSNSVKNAIGSFYPPKKVLIDPTTLTTLPKRHFNNGMAEMIKYGMIYSKDFFEEIKANNVLENIEYYIYKSLRIKKHFVESDEFDRSIRQILNFGHTFGHAYEAYYNYDKYLHGEAISLGMLEIVNEEIKPSLLEILIKYNLPTKDSTSKKVLIKLIKNDKKNTSNYLNLICVDAIGKGYIKKIKISEL
ncbi:MAG: 3-dehydroquinate synthase [Candidatus Izimaplasma sp.]|nr:3-dehydroquinate synthase [Candidatus Izimaplasma bacterium]